MKRSITILAGVVLTFCVALPCTRADDELSPVFSRYIEEFPATLIEFIKQGKEVSPEEFCVVSVYQNFNMQPLWVTGNGPGDRAKLLLSRLRHSDLDGLEPSHYKITDMANLWQSRNSIDLARLDVMLTTALLTYLGDLQEGRRSPRNIDPKLFAYACSIDVDPIATLRNMRDSIDFIAFLDSYVPKHFQYIDLRQALVSYRTIAKMGGWPQVPTDGPMIRPDKTDKRIPTIRLRLTMTGDHPYNYDRKHDYDLLLQKSVKKFQKRHGLKIDGIIGPATLNAMNIPVETRLRQIILNMERWRWKKHDLGEKYVLVDIAGFRLQGIENDAVVIEMPVIVGKPYLQTPVFSNRIRYVVFNPYWNIPRSIARKEILPKLIKDPGYLIEKHIRVFSNWLNDAVELDPYNIDWQKLGRKIVNYHLRQDSGPWNVLGTIKFIFPNRHNVYLHDTLTQKLFEHHKRTFSHGCIRVAEPHQLALFVFGGENGGWTQKRIEEMVATGKRTIVNLPQPISVHITYRTVWLDPAGIVHFRDDVYNRDKKLIKALFQNEDVKNGNI